MSNLTPEGLHAVSDIAARRGFSADAASHLFDSLLRSQGAQAQFSHPELGGMGQWSRGGMIMIGDMFNQALKDRVGALCNDLAAWLVEQSSGAAPGQRSSSQSQSHGRGTSFFNQDSSSSWPEELGQPSSTGAQNDLSYAFFPSTRRLAIRHGSDLQVYDAGDHFFHGFSQQQGPGQSLTFDSQRGTVRVADLRLVSRDAVSAPDPTPASNPSSHATDFANPVAEDSAMSATPSRTTNLTPFESSIPSKSSEDVLKTIKGLAELHKNGVLTSEEFAAKKAELLSRL